jgi:hypothetical protein
MSDRHPHDGKPFYCALCGAGWHEYGACEEPDCALETEAQAKVRADLRQILGEALAKGPTP